MTIPADLVEELRSSLKGGSKVFVPGEEGYAQGIRRWSEYSEKNAGAVVAAVSTPDISATVVFSATHSIELAVRGGGHSTAGSSSTDGGILLDLSLLRGVTVDPNARTITVQGGALWVDVDTAAAAHGLATVGGTVNHTGVGGLTLGGGWGWLTPRYGLVVDNLLSATVVLADGSVVTASEVDNPDLFWAIRGAGANFGVVVEFVFRAYEQREKVWAGILAFPVEQLSAVVEFANSVMGVDDAAMSFGFSAPPPEKSPVVLVAVFYNGPEGKATEVFAPLIALNPAMNTTGLLPYETLNGMLNGAVPHGGRKTAKGSSFSLPISPDFARSIFDHFSDFLSRVPEANESLILFECIDPTKILTVPQSATAFANRGRYMNSAVMPRWNSPEHDLACREYAREFDRLFRAEKQRKDAAVDESGVGQYANYSETFASASEIYGVNYERLVELKKKYDPGNVFSKWHPIVPPVGSA